MVELMALQSYYDVLIFEFGTNSKVMMAATSLLIKLLVQITYQSQYNIRLWMVMIAAKSM